ncbi:MAG: hypothetical protein KDA33_01225, partial [Phycisphaerales bacterium]|nr:hypothetical protein [Phycisphaerales bacterium]
MAMAVSVLIEFLHIVVVSRWVLLRTGARFVGVVSKGKARANASGGLFGGVFAARRWELGSPPSCG